MTMTWESFYLACFLFGLVLSAVSLLGGLGHFGGHVHLPHVPHLPHAGHLPHGVNATADASSASGTVPWWNAFSIMIFLCWFGAAGYLLTRHGSFVAAVVLLLSVICGLAGGALVFFFLVKVMLPHERELSAEETAIVGAVGKVSCAIRAGGTGELVYEQLGARCSVPARSEDGKEIERQAEVFVVRYEKGVAYVRRWDEVGVHEHSQSETGQP
jgi:hypothetical protein